MTEIIRTNFYYDPVRQGYDTNSWRTISGAPALVGSRLVVDNGSGIPGFAVHFGDFLKGQINLDVNVPSVPGSGDDRMFGIGAIGAGSYIRFNVGSTLKCETSDGITTTISDDILWDSNWTGQNIIFTIRWEAGCAKFFVNGTQVWVTSDNSVPYGPLSLFLYDNAATAMTVGVMSVLGTYSLVENPKTSDNTAPTFTGTIIRSDTATVTENIVFLIPSLFLPFSGVLSQSVSLTENVNIFVPKLTDELNENITVTEFFDFLIVV